MCSFQFKNQMFMIGGQETSRNDFRYRQLIVDGGQVIELGDLPFPFDEGACAVYNDVNIYEQRGSVAPQFFLFFCLSHKDNSEIKNRS